MEAQLAADIDFEASDKAAMAGATVDEHDLLAHRLQRDLRVAEQVGRLPQSVVDGLHALAARYCLQRQYAKAERLYRCGLAARERVLGQTHRDVLDSLIKLAVVVNESGDRFEVTMINFRIKTLAAAIAGQQSSRLKENFHSYEED